MRRVCGLVTVALMLLELTPGAAVAQQEAAAAADARPRSAPPAGEPGPLERIAIRPSPDVPPPQRIAHVAPDWPAGSGGRVRYRVHLVIDSGGRVAEARVLSSSAPDDRAVDATAERAAVLVAVRQWTFDAPAQAPVLLVTYVGAGETEGVVGPALGRPIRIGGGMRPPTKVHHVSPEYPSDARAAGISGVVILEATIDAEGAVVAVQMVRSVPGLDDAAIAAVRQWRYVPTWLNGQPVPVIMTVTVNFQPQG